MLVCVALRLLLSSHGTPAYGKAWANKYVIIQHIPVRTCCYSLLGHEVHALSLSLSPSRFNTGPMCSTHMTMNIYIARLPGAIFTQFIQTMEFRSYSQDPFNFGINIKPRIHFCEFIVTRGDATGDFAEKVPSRYCSGSGDDKEE